MPYELLKLLIEKKALHKFIVNTIDSHSTLDDFSQRYQITLLIRKSTPNIIISAFRWYNTMNTMFGVKQTKVTIFGMIYTRKCS